MTGPKLRNPVKFSGDMFGTLADGLRNTFRGPEMPKIRTPITFRDRKVLETFDRKGVRLSKDSNTSTLSSNSIEFSCHFRKMKRCGYEISRLATSIHYSALLSCALMSLKPALIIHCFNIHAPTFQEKAPFDNRALCLQ